MDWSNEAQAERISRSWVDRIQLLMDQIPGHYLVVYIGAAVVLMAALHALFWEYQIVPYPRLTLLAAPVSLWYVWPLASIQLMDNLAARAIRAFQPALGGPDDEIERLKTRLVTMPRTPAMVVSFVFFAITLATNLAFPQLQDSYLGAGGGRLLFTLIGSFGFFFVGAMIFHSTRQLKVIRELYERAEHLSVFYPDQSYAFSSVTAATAISWAVFIYVTVAVVPELITNPVYMPITLAFVLTILFSIISVLSGVNRKLRREKAALRANAVGDLQATFARLHGEIGSEDLSETPNLVEAIAGLKDEIDFIDSLSTWPWQPGTVVGVASALLLPAVVVIIQEVARRLLL